MRNYNKKEPEIQVGHLLGNFRNVAQSCRGAKKKGKTRIVVQGRLDLRMELRVLDKKFLFWAI